MNLKNRRLYMKATGIVRRIDDLGRGGNSKGNTSYNENPRGRPA